MRALVPAGALLIGLLASPAVFGQAAAGTPTAPPPSAASAPAAPPPSAAPAPAAPPPSAAPAPAPQPPAPTAGPPPQGPPGYYVEQGPVPPAPPPNTQPPYGAPPPGGPYGAPPVYEPPPPGMPMVVYEPPPPPTPRHVAPRTALWLAARVGWFVPFGSAYARGYTDAYGNLFLASVPMTDYLRSGPAFELDAGLRLGRNYNLFGLWQRAQLRSGHGPERDLYGGQNGGDSDFFAAGLRATSDADGFGLTSEIAIGYRQARAKWEDGTELHFTGGAFESRIGIGADLRLSPLFTVAPMIELGIGSFDHVRRVLPGGGSYNVLQPYDAAGSHGWWMFTIGGSVDLFGGG